MISFSSKCGTPCIKRASWQKQIFNIDHEMFHLKKSLLFCSKRFGTPCIKPQISWLRAFWQKYFEVLGIDLELAVVRLDSPSGQFENGTVKFRRKETWSVKTSRRTANLPFSWHHNYQKQRFGSMRKLGEAQNEPPYSSLPNKRTCTPDLILTKLPPCTLLFGPVRLSIFGIWNFLSNIQA